MAKKFDFAAAPTFTKAVDIPRVGRKPLSIEFNFIGRDKEGYDELMANMDWDKPIESVLKVASGWELEEEFGEDSLKRMFKDSSGAAREILMVYVREQNGLNSAARLGN